MDREKLLMEHLLCAGAFGPAFQGSCEVGITSSRSGDNTETQEVGGRSRVTQPSRGRAGIWARPGWLHSQCSCYYPHSSHLPGQLPSRGARAEALATPGTGSPVSVCQMGPFCLCTCVHTVESRQ